MWRRAGAGTGSLWCIQHANTGNIVQGLLAGTPIMVLDCGWSHRILSGTHVGGVHVFGDGLQVELVLVAFSMDFMNDFLVIVVTDGTAEFVIVHARLSLTNAP